MAFLPVSPVSIPSTKTPRRSHLTQRRPPTACAVSNPAPARLEDREVPEGHQGLHGYLYSEGDAEHSADTKEKVDEPDFFSHGGRIFPAGLFLEGVADERVVGVYAIYDSEGQCSYIGMGRDVGKEVSALNDKFGEKVHGVRIKTWTFPKREEMISIKEEWSKEYIDGDDVNGEWEKVAREGWLKGDERAKWEEKKTKLRKAMADMSLVDELEELERLEDSEEARIQRENISKAVEADDWSGEIDKQTAETVGKANASTVVSPFASNSTGSQSESSKNLLALTNENVEAVLDEVRPYLVSDGGNVSLLSIENNNINLQLEGACGTCASSTTTMKMGIERALREKLLNVGDVTAVNEPLAVKEMSVPLVESILSEVRPAVEGLGGSFRVLAAEDGVVKLEYSGSDQLVYGMELMLKDRLPDMRSIEVVKC
eukprot:Plantae.Rhodophyta-Hildenbrandia_rubra.ctg3742.p1 GENE.Plantae.Rhodophyta-Hildenbrandia_rubra.ctg3742~~Plantae.Rhodophyta-Hildenbrandia_rubra.ctg3742.p1  ORF type:complete len:429 (-),score=91.32 Plantae.Rhodophyta-Hildenbrandia_rubra.ctg3742:2711-3997(-)